MKRLKTALLILVGFALLTASKCVGETPIEVCYEHPRLGMVCVKINGKRYDLNRPDLNEADQKEAREWLAKQPK